MALQRSYHQARVNEVIEQLEAQGYVVIMDEISFGSACGTGLCRPDIPYITPDGQLGIYEIKTGNAGLSFRQSEIFPQIMDGSAIPRGPNAEKFGFELGIPLSAQGLPNGIPIDILRFPGVGQ